MKQVLKYVLFLAAIFAYSCARDNGDKVKSNDTIVLADTVSVDIDGAEFYQMEEDGVTSIQIRSNFNPTIELTDQIRNTTLEQLIYDYCATHKFGNYEVAHYLELSLSYNKGKSELVAADSNLAKVYFMQDFEDFMLYNYAYFMLVRNRYEKSVEKIAQGNWEKYI